MRMGVDGKTAAASASSGGASATGQPLVDASAPTAPPIDTDAAAAAALARAADALASSSPDAALAAYNDLETVLNRPGLARQVRRHLEAARLRTGAAAGVANRTLLRIPGEGVVRGAVSASFRRLAGLIHPDKLGPGHDGGAAFRVLVAAAEAVAAEFRAARGAGGVRVGPDHPIPSSADWWSTWASSTDSDDGAIDAAAAADAETLVVMTEDELRAEVAARQAAVFDTTAPGTQAERGMRLTAARAALAARLAATGKEQVDEARGGFFVK